ncbi:MAG TPA: hypothetical protein VIU37_08845 [Candidatus Limnocylindrales bacterium]|jgi:hypothetical protein
MALQSTPREGVSFEDIVRVLLVVAAVIVVMFGLNLVFGFNGTGPWTDLTVDPGRPF